MTEIDSAIYEIAQAEHPLTVRGLFYRVMSRGLVPKTESGYSVVQRQALKMRRTNELPYSWITDGTRLRLQPNTWSRIDDALRVTAYTYRKALWDNQNHHIEIWAEKDAIRGVVYPVTAQFDVPLLIARGYASETFLHQTAEEIRRDHKPAVIYQLGDHDRDGVRAWNAIQKRLREFVPADIELHFQRIAVTSDQIAGYELPTRPDKTDSGFGDCVEVDAMPTPQLRQLVADAIESWIDPEALRLTKVAEASEKEVLTRIATGWREGATDD